MKNSFRTTYCLGFSALAVLLAAAGCPPAGGLVFDHGGTSSQGGSGGAGPDDDALTTVGQGGSGECSTDAECTDGICNNGTCCELDSVCGDGCCPTGDVCLFDACVTPGDECVTEEDCPDKHYCEPALGESTPPIGNCTQPLVTGKCVPLPPKCSEEPTNPDCIEDCEYHPPVGELSAVTKWQWGYAPAPAAFPEQADVWSTPAVGRIFDANCDGKVDLADPPNVVFVSGNANGGFCQGQAVCNKGVLRLLDGNSGEELWSLDKAEPSSVGFAAVSVAIGDVDNDQEVDIVALTGEGRVVVLDRNGQVTHTSADSVDDSVANTFGWGGGIALGDMDNDGWTEIAFGNNVFTMTGGTLSLRFKGTAGSGGGVHVRTTHFADLDNDQALELIAGNTAYRADGSQLWMNAAVGDGKTATGDFDLDGLPEVVLVGQAGLYILDGATGQVELGPHVIPGIGQGGPPTVADFDGDGAPEVGIAKANLYSVLKPNYGNSTVTTLWSTQNHDNSSSVTGSSVFDFQGDGKAEVVYMDECFLWVYDGTTGDVVFTANSQSFTGTEAPVVADVDGDGHAEILMVHNGANPWGIWHCAHHDGSDGYPAWSLPAAGAYRGVTLLGDVANAWVGTRTLWNQHAYSVSNICDPRDTACSGNVYYGQIPAQQEKNWQQPWLNNFRQNVQDTGLFDAPDPVVDLDVACSSPVDMTVYVRNLGFSTLPPGVEAAVFKQSGEQLGSVFTTKVLLAGQTEQLAFSVPMAEADANDVFYAELVVDPDQPIFRECRPENNRSAEVSADCPK